MYLKTFLENREKQLDQYLSDSHGHMYYEDWTNEILPFVYRDTKTFFKVVINNSSTPEIVLKLFAKGNFKKKNAESIVSDFFKDLAQWIMYSGRANYQITPTAEKGQSHYELRHFQTKHQAFNFLYRNDKNILTIKEPCWIEDGVGFLNSIKNLTTITKSNFLITSFFRKNSLGEKTYFDYPYFKKKQLISILNCTKASGWCGRTLYTEEMTEFYHYLRLLRFKLNQAKLREHILKQINDFLQQTDLAEIKGASISLEGLHSANELARVEKEYLQGKISFKKLYEDYLSPIRH